MQQRLTTLLLAATATVLASAGEAVPCEGAEECEISSLLQSQVAKETLLSKTATAGITQIKDNYIEINGRGYSRYNAHDALLGSIGTEFKGTFHIPPKLTFVEGPQSGMLEGNSGFGSSVRIASSQESSFNIDLASKAIPQTDIEAGLSGNHSHNSSFYLKEIKINSNFELIKAMNSDKFKSFRKYLTRKLLRPRIVTSVWVLIEGDQEKDSACHGGKVNVSVGDSGHITISGSGCKMNTWSFSPDTVMAYTGEKMSFNDNGGVKNLVPDMKTR